MIGTLCQTMAALTPVNLFAPIHFLSLAQTPSLQVQPSESVSCIINQPQLTLKFTCQLLPLITQPLRQLQHV